MKVLLGHSFYRSSSPSGEDAVYRSEKALLESQGIEVISYEKHNDDIRDTGIVEKISNGVECIWSTRAHNELIAILEKVKPDIVHFHNTFPQISPSAYAACRESKVPVVQTLHNYRFVCPNGLLLRENKPCEDCLSGTLFSALRHRCYRQSLLATSALAGNIALSRRNGSYSTGVHRYIALTEFAKSRLVAGGLPVERICVKPNFLEDVKICRLKQNYAVYVGRLSQEKGIRTLIDAWRHSPSLPLKIIGDGPLRTELEALAKQQGLAIEFLGQRSKEEVINIVGAAMLQVVPSECYEGFPLVVLEAFATGTPVVASRIGSLAEIIVDGQNGFLFPPGDSSQLAALVAQLAKDSTTLDEVSTAARSAYDLKYTPEKNFAQLMDIYQQAIGEFLRQPN